MDHSGKCMCGAVSFQVKDLNLEFGTCHCKMCQRWAGSALLGLTIPDESITFQGLDNVKTFQSSDWAERAWCDKCGSGLWYRAKSESIYHMPIGLLDDTSGLKMTREIFVDKMAQVVDFSGTRQTMTGAEVFALYAPSEE
ncbi:MAG: GFA family protein [Rhodobacteraceae bacterium]|nr:GFA family protein [Paracoccaceae bacterium]